MPGGTKLCWGSTARPATSQEQPWGSAPITAAATGSDTSNTTWSLQSQPVPGRSLGQQQGGVQKPHHHSGFISHLLILRATRHPLLTPSA